jgi:hypothetical protein
LSILYCLLVHFMFFYLLQHDFIYFILLYLIVALLLHCSAATINMTLARRASSPSPPDDWKALVDSVQKDRSRLQDECHSLEEELSTAYDELNRMEEEREQERRRQEQQGNGHDETEQAPVDGTPDAVSPPPPSLPECQQHPSDDILEFESETETETETERPTAAVVDVEASPVEQVSTPVKSSLDAPLTPITSAPVALSDTSEKKKDAQLEGGSALPLSLSLSRTSSTSSSRATTPRSSASLHTSMLKPPHTPRCSTTPPPTPLSSRRASTEEGSSRDQEPTTPPSSSSSVVAPPPLQQLDSPRAVVRELRKELAKAHAEVREHLHTLLLPSLPSLLTCSFSSRLPLMCVCSLTYWYLLPCPVSSCCLVCQIKSNWTEQIDILRKTSQTESLAQEQEIARLRDEVYVLRRREQQAGGGGGFSAHTSSAPESSPGSGAGETGRGGGAEEQGFSHGESSYPPAIPPPPAVKRQPPPPVSIWSSPFSVLGYFFSYSSPSSSAPSSSSVEPLHTSAQKV